MDAKSPDISIHLNFILIMLPPCLYVIFQLNQNSLHQFLPQPHPSCILLFFVAPLLLLRYGNGIEYALCDIFGRDAVQRGAIVENEAVVEDRKRDGANIVEPD